VFGEVYKNKALYFFYKKMAIYKVRKRNWTIVSFDRSRIETAIKKSIESAGGADFSKIKEMVDVVIEQIDTKSEGNSPDVETIQDIIEEVLIKEGHDTVAKNYILYRQKRAAERKKAKRKVTVDVAGTMEEYIRNLDRRVNENANVWHSVGGLILRNSEKIVANYWLSQIYPDEVWNVHRNWDLHIHDLWFFTAYCAGWSLRALLEEWFNGVPDKVASTPPKHLNSAVNQMVNFFGTLQNERAWAQAFSSFDTYLAPFVHKYSEELSAEFDEIWAQFKNEEEKQKAVDKKTYKYVVQCMQNFIFGLNTPSRRGTQTPFTNITLDRECPRDLKEKALLIGGLDSWLYKKKFGELEKEMRMVNRALIQVYTKGDKNGRIFTFPIPTYNITEDFDRDDPDVTALFEMTAKYGIPYFQNFIGSQYIKTPSWEKERDPKAYKPDDVRSMCCRLQLDLEELKKRWWGLFWSAEMTGSIWVVTINMARIAYNNKWDMQWFQKQLKKLMDLAKMSLEMKRVEVSKRHKAWFYPYTKRYLPSFRNHFSTIGTNWMNEAILNFTDGKLDLTSKKWVEISLEILDFMREILTSYQEETGHLYNLEASPAEWASYRFAKEDKKQLTGIIQAGTEDAPYYTNSSWLPVTYTEDAFEALDLQDEQQCKYTWWTVLHLYLGERITDSEACKAIVKKAIWNYRMPYISITPTFSICPKHWYIAGEHDYCPKCDKEIGFSWEKYDLETRKIYTADEGKFSEYAKKIVNNK